jgi:hypothetical protein
MMNVTTYNVYVEPAPAGAASGAPVLIGDAQNGSLTLDQAGPAIIDVNAIGGLAFANPPLSYAGEPTWCAWATPTRRVASAATEVAINVINATPGELTVNLNLVDGSSVPLTIVKSLA